MTSRASSRILAVAERIFPWTSLRGSIYRRASGKARSLLDVGCGRGDTVRGLISLGAKFQGVYLVGADIWLPYLVDAKKVYHDIVRCDIRRLPFQPSSFDLVIATDILEHLGKVEGHDLLEVVEEITRSQVFVFTPVGYNAKEHLEGGNPWQAHRSGWHSYELKRRGYVVRGMNAGRFLYRQGEYEVSPRFWLLIVPLKLLSSILTFLLVEGAYQMLCFKDKNSTNRNLASVERVAPPIEIVLLGRPRVSGAPRMQADKSLLRRPENGENDSTP